MATDEHTSSETTRPVEGPFDQAALEPPGEPARSEDRPSEAEGAIAATRTSRIWVGLIPATLALTAILVFVFENTQRVRVRFFGAGATFRLGLALLGAAALGGLIVFCLGTVRIVQLRAASRRRSRRSR